MDKDNNPNRKFKPGGAPKERREPSSPEHTPPTSPEVIIMSSSDSNEPINMGQERSPNVNPLVIDISSDESGVGRSLNVSANLGSSGSTDSNKDEIEISPKPPSDKSEELFSDVSSKESSSKSSSDENIEIVEEGGSQETFVVSSSGSGGVNGRNHPDQDGGGSEETYVITSDESGDANGLNQNNQHGGSPEVYAISDESVDVNGVNQLAGMVIDDSTYDIPEGGSMVESHNWTNPNYFNNPQIKESPENPLPESNEEDQSSVEQSQKSVLSSESSTSQKSVTESLGSLHIFSTPTKSDESQTPVEMISPQENENVEDLLPADSMTSSMSQRVGECLPSHSLNNPQEYSGYRSELIQTLQKCSPNQSNSASSSAPSTDARIIHLGYLDDQAGPSTSTQSEISSDIPNVPLSNPQMKFPSRHPAQGQVNAEVPGENRLNLRKKLMVDIEMKKKVKFLLKNKVMPKVEESTEDETDHEELNDDNSDSICKISEEENENDALKNEPDSLIFSSLPSYQPGGGFVNYEEEEEGEETDYELEDEQKKVYKFSSLRQMSEEKEDHTTEEIRSQQSPIPGFQRRPLSKETVSPDVFSDDSVDGICSGRFISSTSQLSSEISQNPQPSQKSLEEKGYGFLLKKQVKRLFSSSDEEEDSAEDRRAKYIRKRGPPTPFRPRKRLHSLSDGDESGSESSDVETRSPEPKKSKGVPADSEDEDPLGGKVFVGDIDVDLEDNETEECRERDTLDVQIPFQIQSKRKRGNSLSDGEESGSESSDVGTRSPEPKKSKVISEYIEDQAILSGEESSDEEENDDDEEDEAIIDFDDEELNIPESKLRDQIGQIHLKKTNEDDESLLQQLKNDFLDEGDLYNEGGSRSKNYSWSFPSTSQAQDIANLSAESEEEDEKTAVDENKLKWLKETAPLPEDTVEVPKEKKNIKLNIISKKQHVVKKDDVKKEKGKRGSFMRKGRDVIKDMDM